MSILDSDASGHMISSIASSDSKLENDQGWAHIDRSQNTSAHNLANAARSLVPPPSEEIALLSDISDPG